ncbi:hypothetical protein BDN72DRAFT_906024 [Pluteus cervinus]|uniref:Uncharacterized protein n=1 Tax=Pluteus cervinus TaxID=181527 RepID=A0ACD3A0T5_9AGAR|nr:hypothetical protein BDN72DRAFT_906024 [Pluteus cervinus]
MGRPRLYHTPEAKAAANRAKSTRSYNKYKTDINRRRRAHYRADNPDAIPRPPLRRHNTESMRTLDDITNNTPLHHFIDNLVRTYLAKHDELVLSRPLAMLEKHLRDVQQLEGLILQEQGAGEKWYNARQATLRVQGAVQAMEEIICTTLTCDLAAEHQAGRLMYQKQ